MYTIILLFENNIANDNYYFININAEMFSRNKCPQSSNHYNQH